MWVLNACVAPLPGGRACVTMTTRALTCAIHMVTGEGGSVGIWHWNLTIVGCVYSLGLYPNTCSHILEGGTLLNINTLINKSYKRNP